mmetsp:Transcript_30970/g.49722  ORF Transcript_30970/g.49722 Transcript_30970/m.49722 type:complete len:221 (+) Transcript_30970:908-1570(+)|eukprot:CAMPEP_0197054764 /NCGR_PEP_ID=MMETSP1384-20130603/49156_1 /TAXON_ID=29189 /ORGANISM="Ammonia sp." /LENGTH=220 /DNA_ID=CAMNT_0042488065 /DNA_START=444 /DNA_END=1106 /DNA_ORIENTATION=-
MDHVDLESGITDGIQPIAKGCDSEPHDGKDFDLATNAQLIMKRRVFAPERKRQNHHHSLIRHAQKSGKRRGTQKEPYGGYADGKQVDIEQDASLRGVAALVVDGKPSNAVADVVEQHFPSLVGELSVGTDVEVIEPDPGENEQDGGERAEFSGDYSRCHNPTGWRVWFHRFVVGTVHDARNDHHWQEHKECEQRLDGYRQSNSSFAFYKIDVIPVAMQDV